MKKVVIICMLVCGLQVFSQDTLYFSQLDSIYTNHLPLNPSTAGKFLQSTGGMQGRGQLVRDHQKSSVQVQIDSGACCFWKGVNINRIGPGQGFGPVDSLYYTFSFQFGEDFDPRLGGKFGWGILVPGANYNGQVPEVGQFSISNMFRTEEKNLPPDAEPYLHIYVYHNKQGAAYPFREKFPQIRLKRKQVYQLEYFIDRIANRLVVRLNGKTLLDDDTYVFSETSFRWNPNFINFYGGSNPADWAPRRNSSWSIGDLLVLSGRPASWFRK